MLAMSIRVDLAVFGGIADEDGWRARLADAPAMPQGIYSTKLDVS